MNIIDLIGLFLLGLIFGSFGSVILQRIDGKMSRKTLQGFLFGRSQCPQCIHTLARYDLMPLFSWMSMRGRCRYCKAPISTLYPVLEIVSGLVFVIWGIRVSQTGSMLMDELFILWMWWLLGLVFVWDMYTYELHVPVWMLLVTSAVVHRIMLIMGGGWLYPLGMAVALFILFVGLYYFAIWYTRKRFGVKQEGFGRGDVMLAPVLGYMMGIQGPLMNNMMEGMMGDAMVITLFMLGASLVGVVYFICVKLLHLISQKIDIPDSRHSTGAAMIPFLPAMIVSYRLLSLFAIVLL